MMFKNERKERDGEKIRMEGRREREGEKKRIEGGTGRQRLEKEGKTEYRTKHLDSLSAKHYVNTLYFF